MSGAKFKFIDKFDDMVQDAVDNGTYGATDEIRDQIDYMITEKAYEITGDVMEKFKLDNSEIFGPDEEVHDEIFQEVHDKLYNELGLY